MMYYVTMIKEGKGGDTMIKRKYVVLLLLTLVSIPLTGLFCSNLVQANFAVKGYVSVSAAAFVSKYSTSGTQISNWLTHGENITVYFYGAIQLPNGSIITEVTSYWHDMGNEDIVCLLRRYDQTQDQIVLNVSSSGDSGLNSTTVHTDVVVDNSQYAYYFEVGIPGEQNGHGLYRFQYVIIEYEHQTGAGVGGFYIPVDKFSILAPYIAYVSTIILVVSISVAYVKYRKKQ